jgi:nucleoid-associated protein YgaU
MDRGARIVLACVVLVGGILLAMPFRRPARPDVRPEPSRRPQAALGEQNAAGVGELLPPARTTVQIEPAVTRPPGSFSPPARRSTASDGMAPPPELPKVYPRSDSEAEDSAYPWAEADSPGVEASDPEARTHKIVDGDTLANVAERYLGDPGREWEIYEANRNRLENPNLLPIGLELKIPPRLREPAPEAGPSPEPSLVPILRP